MPLATLIVDDEPLAREGLRMLLAGDAAVGPIFEARNGREAVAAIREQRPDLVFLDVQMPALDGIGVVREIGAARMPAVVFVTAHDEYAVQAFEINAIDYLLKPFTSERFAHALARAKARLGQREDDARSLGSLVETVASPSACVKRLAVRSAGRIFFVEVDTVDWFQAAENYVELHTGQGSHLLHVSMNTLEKSLDPEVFLRIHRSLIVNTRRIRDLKPATHGEYVITLTSGARLQSGRTYHERIRSLTENPF
jgi:two-component system LytT family response regulator